MRYAPVGVVGVIGPWNYPLVNSFGDAIPALAAGNTVLLKPSEVTPLTSMLLAEGCRESGMPEHVLQILVGGADTGAALIDEADFVMFTGSTATGKKVMARAAETLTPVALELGGKDPMIVLADADLERAANAATYYSMQNGGQTCVSIERVYVEAPVYDQFVDAVTEQVKALRQGVPAGPGSVEVGAVTFSPQLDIVRRHVEQARDAGARITAGGHVREGAGRFFEPTVLADVDHSMTAMTEETFGPTVPIMKVADADEAIRMANDSPYGLGASVWTKDGARGEQIARRLESGYACVNDANVNYFAYELPMGGWKDSGLGVRHGAGGIRKYTRQQAILVTRVALKRDVALLPVLRPDYEAAGAADEAAVRAREAGLASATLTATNHSSASRNTGGPLSPPARLTSSSGASTAPETAIQRGSTAVRSATAATAPIISASIAQVSRNAKLSMFTSTAASWGSIPPLSWNAASIAGALPTLSAAEMRPAPRAAVGSHVRSRSALRSVS